MKPALVLLNPHAHQGQAPFLWERVELFLSAKLGRLEVIPTESVEQFRTVIQTALLQGQQRYIAAGGDGAVHLLVQSLLEATGGRPATLVVGAVGLGSSNDFHKPQPKTNLVSGLPVRLDFSAARPHDLGMAEFTDESGESHQEAFVVNASLGLTAEANHFFNHPDRVLSFLKRHWVNGAILYAAVRTLGRYRNQPVSLGLGTEEISSEITILSIMKNPHVSGSLVFDTPVGVNDGLFAVNLAEGMNKREVLGLMNGLSKGHFLGRKKTRQWKLPRLQVTPAVPMALELDGEVWLARRVKFSILPSCLSICGPGLSGPLAQEDRNA